MSDFDFERTGRRSERTGELAGRFGVPAERGPVGRRDAETDAIRATEGRVTAKPGTAPSARRRRRGLEELLLGDSGSMRRVVSHRRLLRRRLLLAELLAPPPGLRDGAEVDPLSHAAEGLGSA